MTRRSERLAQCFPLACVLFFCVSGATKAQELPFTLKQVGPNVWAAISNPKSKVAAGANTGFVIGTDGVVVIDTSASIDAGGTFATDPAKQVLAAIRTVTHLPVKFVINTHHHWDHVGGNSVFAEAGATVLSHHNVRGWIHAENLRMFGSDIKPPQKAFIEALRPPSVTYNDTLNLYLGSREIQVWNLPGHTGGDSVVLIPDAKVAFTGDLFWRNMLPNLMDASTKPWIDTLDMLAKTQADATFVPGHGEVGTVQDVTSFREYLVTLRNLVSEAHASGKSGDAVVAGVMPALRDKYSGWDGDAFDYFAKSNILDLDAELRGNKRIPQPGPRNP